MWFPTILYLNRNACGIGYASEKTNLEWQAIINAASYPFKSWFIDKLYITTRNYRIVANCIQASVSLLRHHAYFKIIKIGIYNYKNPGTFIFSRIAEHQRLYTVTSGISWLCYKLAVSSWSYIAAMKSAMEDDTWYLKGWQRHDFLCLYRSIGNNDTACKNSWVIATSHDHDITWTVSYIIVV